MPKKRQFGKKKPGMNFEFQKDLCKSLKNREIGLLKANLATPRNFYSVKRFF